MFKNHSSVRQSEWEQGDWVWKRKGGTAEYRWNFFANLGWVLAFQQKKPNFFNFNGSGSGFGKAKVLNDKKQKLERFTSSPRNSSVEAKPLCFFSHRLSHLPPRLPKV